MQSIFPAAVAEMAASISPAADHQTWLTEFKAKYGRPPRVLHIGNIANNAYNNAKLLNETGLDCDVICYDYYHIMGCPEWEDADFEGEIEDQFFPNWNSVNLNGFARPKWFAQGPLRLCINYLIARRRGNAVRARFWWYMMAAHRTPQARWLLLRVVKSVRRVVKSVRRVVKSVRRVVKASSRDILGLALGLFLMIDIKLAGGGLACYSVTCLACRLAPPLIPLVRRQISFAWRLVSGRDSNEREVRTTNFDERVRELVERFEKVFPERPDKLVAADVEEYRHCRKWWLELFDYYDFVQGYATDPFLPLLVGKRGYTAFEHGTLRKIPFEANSLGRRTALAYHEAKHVFVTNADCLENARLLAGGLVSFINHPYDEDHGMNLEGPEELREELCKALDADFLVFFPTRQDWVPGTGYADKANDTFIGAFARLRREGCKIGMVCCNWGANVKESQKLIKELGCFSHVRWGQPMGTVRFERYALACDIVIDQFKLGAFGGIVFKAMSCSAPVCTHLGKDRMQAQYGDTPPVINCKTEDEIVSRLKEVMQNRLFLKDIGEASRTWIKKHHASVETVRTQIGVFRKLAGNGSQNGEDEP